MTHSVWKTYGPTAAHGEHKGYGKATYSDIAGPGGHLAHLEPFDGNSMRATGEHVTDELVWVVKEASNGVKHQGWKYQQLPPEEHHYVYTVYSYSEPIARVVLPSVTDEQAGRDLYKELWINHRQYSPTTSKHQSYTRSWLGHATDLRWVDA